MAGVVAQPKALGAALGTVVAPAEVHRRVNPLLLRVFLFLLKTKRSVEFWLF